MKLRMEKEWGQLDPKREHLLGHLDPMRGFSEKVLLMNWP